jgi:hypothetical protein
MRSSEQGPEQSEEVRDAASVLSATLSMIVNDFDSLDAAEIRELAWVAKYEADKLMSGLRLKAIGRRIARPEEGVNRLRGRVQVFSGGRSRIADRAAIRRMRWEGLTNPSTHNHEVALNQCPF